MLINPPLVASLYLTNHCQLQCGHCFFVNKGQIGKHMLSLNKIKKVVEKLSKNKILMLVISGGDPMLHPNFNEIIDLIIDNRMVPLIGITGLEMDSGKLTGLLNSGIKNLQISIDDIESSLLPIPPERKINGLIDRNIEKYLEYGFLLTIAICVFHENTHNVMELISYFLKKNVHKIKISFWIKTKECEGGGYNQTTTSDCLFILNTVSKLSSADKDKIVIPGYSLHDGVYKKENHPNKGLVVMPDGNIVFNEFSDPIGNIYVNDPVSVFLKEIKKNSISEIEKIKNEFISKYNISDIWEVSRKDLSGSGALIITDDRRIISIADDLTNSCQLFVIVHEIGHLTLNLINKNPYGNSPRDIEIIVNTWAVEALKPYVSSCFYRQAIKYAEQDMENELFSFFDYKLSLNLMRG